MTKRSPPKLAAENQPDKVVRGQSTALHRINSMGRQLFHAFTHSMGQNSASSQATQKSNCEHRDFKPRQQPSDSATKESTTSTASKQPRKSVAGDCCLSIITNANRHFQKQEAKREAKRRDEVQKSSSSSSKHSQRQEELFRLDSDETDPSVLFTKVIGPKLSDQFSANYQRSAGSFEIQASGVARVVEPNASIIQHNNQINCNNDPQGTSTTTQPNSIKSTLLDDINATAGGYSAISKSKSICSQYARSKRNNSEYKLSQLIELLDKIADRHKQQHDAKQLDRASNSIDKAYEIDEGDAFYLERNWSQFVEIEQQNSRASSTKSVSCESLPRSQSGCEQATTPTDQNRSSDNQLNNLRIQQDAIWELLRTELLYIKGLKAIIDVFLATLNELQQSSFLVEVNKQTNKLQASIIHLVA